MAISKTIIGSPNKSIGRKGYKPEAIVIHIMEGTLTGTDSWFSNPASAVSAHYGIGTNGEIHQYVDEKDTAWQAGRVNSPSWKNIKSSGPGAFINPNYYTIGIEHEGDQNSEWTEAMYNTSASLIQDICQRNNIPIDRDHIIGHHEIYSLKCCPGFKVDLNKLVHLASTVPILADVAIQPPELTKIVQKGTATSSTRLNIRKEKPDTESAIITTVVAGSQLPYIGYVENGKNINGNSKWFFTAEGNYFWSGGISTILLEPKPPVKSSLNKIEHIFVLMLENRSFDHMLGFSNLKGKDADTGADTVIEGLTGTESNLDVPALPVTVQAGCDFIFTPDPPHEFENIMEQLCGEDAILNAGCEYPPINNGGFVSSYRKVESTPGRVMKCFKPEEVPVITKLASEFAVCDHWFSSLPGPTWPNRFFIHAASSAGLYQSPPNPEVIKDETLYGYEFENGTIYDRLQEKGVDWRIYKGDDFPQSYALKGMMHYSMMGHLREFEDFKADLAKPGFSPSYVFIEPNYGSHSGEITKEAKGGNSQHPVGDVRAGEKLIKDVYEAIRNSPLWEKSMLLITYDEHGGFYDHVKPPAIVCPGDALEDKNKLGFDFKQLGVRVPAIVISPYIPSQTIDHNVYDHTSLLKTVEKRFALQPLTVRDRNANSFEQLFSLDVPRMDAPLTISALDVPPQQANVPLQVAVASTVTGIEGSIVGYLHIAFLKYVSPLPEGLKEDALNEFKNIKTNTQAQEYIQKVKERLQKIKDLGA
jgi:phospholipase C